MSGPNADVKHDNDGPSKAVEALSYLISTLGTMSADACRADRPDDWRSLLQQMERIRQVTTLRIVEYMEDALWASKGDEAAQS